MVSLPSSTSSGFTLTELIVTLLVIAILAVVAVAKLSNMNVVQQRAEYDKVVSAIKYARKSAIAQRRYACVSVSATAVSFTADPNPPEATAIPFGGTCPFANTLALPAPDASCAASNQTCVKTTSITSTSSTFQFDPRGRAAAQVLVTVSGFPTITVEGETGYVH
jgi:MSHA pilin protein MshC